MASKRHHWKEWPKEGQFGMEPRPLFLTPKQTAARLQVCEETVHEAMRRGQLEFRVIGNCKRVLAPYLYELAVTRPERVEALWKGGSHDVG